jgi:hypothetical protein
MGHFLPEALVPLLAEEIHEHCRHAEATASAGARSLAVSSS